MSARIEVGFDAESVEPFVAVVGVDDEMMAKLVYQFYVQLAKASEGWIASVQRFDIRGVVREAWSCT